MHNVLPKTNTYVKSYDGETKWIDLSTEDDDLLEIYTSIWNEISNRMKTFLKNKIRSYIDEATDFQDKGIIYSELICLAVIVIDFVLKR